MIYLNYVISSLIEELCHTCCSTDFSECTIKGDPEYKTFDELKHDFKGEQSYVLVRTNNLPNYVPDVYIEAIFRRSAGDDDSQQHGDSSSEEDHSLAMRGEKEDDGSEKHEEHHGLPEIKIRVYNHTVEFKNNWRLVVSIMGIFYNILPPSHFSVALIQQAQYWVHGIIYFFPPANNRESAEGNNQRYFTVVRQMMCYKLNYALSYVISLLALSSSLFLRMRERERHRERHREREHIRKNCNKIIHLSRYFYVNV